MALTDTEKSQIRRWLGYPDINRLHHQNLEDAMDAVSSDGEVIIREILAELIVINTQIAADRTKSQVTRVEDVWFSGSEGLESLREDARRLVCDLAALLDVQVLRLPFSSGGNVGIALRG